jgi:hypothetical protein
MNPCTEMIDARFDRNTAGPEIDKSEGPNIRADAIIFAESWAALHNAELWGAHVPPKLNSNQLK